MKPLFPLVVAHRGASATERENTVAAFRTAVALGADGVELDVHATADGTVVVHHDFDLPGGAAIATVAAGDLPPWVPTLRDALDACGGLGVNVEVKADAERPASHAFVAAVVEVCREWRGDVLVSSFDDGVVDRVRALGGPPTGQLTLLPDRSAAALAAWIAGRGHVAWHPWAKVLDEEGVAAAVAAGLLVNTWTVDEPERIVELASWGVHGIVTNDVAACRRALGRDA